MFCYLRSSTLETLQTVNLPMPSQVSWGPKKKFIVPVFESNLIFFKETHGNVAVSKLAVGSERTINAEVSTLGYFLGSLAGCFLDCATQNSDY